MIHHHQPILHSGKTDHLVHLTNLYFSLLQRPEDTEEFVKEQLTEYTNNLADLLDVSSEIQPQRINADQDGFTVFELAESKIVNPLPASFLENDDE